MWRSPRRDGDRTMIERIESILGVLGSIVVCIAGTEAGTTTHSPVDRGDAGRGRLAPQRHEDLRDALAVRRLFVVLCRYSDEDGEWRTPSRSSGATRKG